MSEHLSPLETIWYLVEIEWKNSVVYLMISCLIFINLMGDYQTSRYPDMSEMIHCEYYTEAIVKDRVRKAHKIFGVIYPERINL